MPKLPDLRSELLAMASDDLRVRSALAEDGSLYDGYHPEMAAVHKKNAKRLKALIAEHGWLTSDLVGDDGAEAAWLILQHAIAFPSLQRKALPLLKDAMEKGRIPARHYALLLDRIRVFEGKPQLYGTSYDWDENGQLSPLAIEAPENVDARRAEVGLGPLEEDLRRKRKDVESTKEQPPTDFRAHRRKLDEWARSVGWRD